MASATVGTADLIQVRCTACQGPSPRPRQGEAAKGDFHTDPRIAAQLAAVADAWPAAAVIDTEGGGSGGAGRLHAECMRQALEMIRPQGHEDAGALARPYTLSG